MPNSLEITDYYELVALHKTLWLTKFSPNPVDDRIIGSPFIAKIQNQVVEILSKMEIERGRPEFADNWHIKIVPHGELWKILIRNAATGNEGHWRKFSEEQKRKFSTILLAPLVFTEQMLVDFISEVDQYLSSDS